MPHMIFDSPGLGFRSDSHNASRSSTPLKGGKMEMTPAELTQFYVDSMNTLLTTAELKDFRVVTGRVSVQLQQRAAPDGPHEVIYDTHSLEVCDARDLLLALDSVEWSIPSFLQLVADSQLSEEVTP